MQRNTKNSGFTLIELILVLALASILMLMALVAFSGAQKARRDAQRKADLTLFFGKIEEYRANNNDAHPDDQASLNAFVNAYFSGHKDPTTGQNYQIIYHEANHNRHPQVGQIIYGREHFCYVNQDNTPTDIITDYDHDTGEPTDFQHDHYMMVYQEQGAYYCLDNHVK